MIALSASSAPVRETPWSGEGRLLVLVLAVAVIGCRASSPAALPGTSETSAVPPQPPSAPRAGAAEGGAEASPAASVAASPPLVAAPARSSLSAPVLDCQLPPRSRLSGADSGVEYDLAYGPDPAQRYDVAVPERPDTAAAPPWVVLVHGGGWTAGDKRMFWTQLAVLRSLGYAAATVNYRLARDPQRAFPVPVADVACALAAIARESPRLGADASRMVLVGGSAGGHLVTLAAVAQGDPRVLGRCADAFPTPAGVVAFYPPLDLRRTAERYPERLNMAVQELFRVPQGTPAWERVSTLATPLAQLAPPDSAANLALPPFLFILAGSDVHVPHDESRELHEALRARSVPSLLVEVPDLRHGFPILARAAMHRPATCTLLEFLDRTLGPT